MNVNDATQSGYELQELQGCPIGAYHADAGSANVGDWYNVVSNESVKDKGKARAPEHDAMEARPSSFKLNNGAAAAAARSGSAHENTVGPNALATINKAVADFIPHQKRTIEEAHKTLAEQRTLLHGIMEKGEPIEQAAPSASWTSRLPWQASSRQQNDEEAAAPLVTFKDAPLQLRQNALSARATVDHIDGAQNEFAAASQRALNKSEGAPSTNPFRPLPGDRNGAAEDMEAAANQYHVQKSRITATAAKTVGPASTLGIRQSALNTSRAALVVASTAGVGTLGLGITNAVISAHRHS